MTDPVEHLKQMAQAVRQSIKQPEGGPSTFLFFQSSEGGLVECFCTIGADGSVNIPAPQMAIERGQRAKATVAAAIQQAKDTGSGTILFPVAPGILSLEILFGEIARLRTDAAKDKAERNSTD